MIHNQCLDALFGAGAILDRESWSVHSVALVGDDHGAKSTFRVAVESEDATLKQFVLKRNDASLLEYEASRVIRNWLERRGQPNDPCIPNCFYDANSKTFIRSFVEGFSIGYLNAYDGACREIRLLANNSAGFTDAVGDDLIALLNAAPEGTEFDFRRAIIKIIERFPRFAEWAGALGRYYEVPLAGEGLRPFLALAYQIYRSDVKRIVPFQFNAVRHASVLLTTLLRAGLAADVLQAEADRLWNQLRILKALCESCQLYDIHAGNILLSSGTAQANLFLIDYECFGGGTSLDLIPSEVECLTDAIASLGGVDRPPAKQPLPVVEALSSMEPLKAEDLARRVIYCGTSSYEALIRLLKETIFIAAMLRLFGPLPHDFTRHDDIATFPDQWRYFQLWKRVYRGLSDLTPLICFPVDQVFDVVRHAHAGYPTLGGNSIYRFAHALCESVRQLRPACQLSRLILRRIAAPVDSIPFYLYSGSDADTARDVSVMELIGSPASDNRYIDDIRLRHKHQALASICRFEIPVHYLDAHTPYLVRSDVFDRAVEGLRTFDVLADPDGIRYLDELVQFCWSSAEGAVDDIDPCITAIRRRYMAENGGQRGRD